MYNTKLVELADFKKYKQKSDSVNLKKLDQATIEAQLGDIKPLLGERLFNALLKDVSTSGTTYNTLLNEHEYTYNGENYYHNGLKSVVVYYASARYIMFGDVIENPFGSTRKLNKNTSEALDYPTKKSISISDKETAYNLWLDVNNFLLRTEEPLFNCSYSEAPNTFRISKIGR